MSSFSDSLLDSDAPKHSDGSSLVGVSLSDKLQAVYDAFVERGIDLNDIGDVDKISYWTNGTDALQVAFKFTPAWEKGPDWPLVQPGKPVKVSRPKSVRDASAKTVKVAVLPDPQVGFLRTKNNQLVPLHDPSAIEVALAVTKDFQPDRVVLVGDYMDFAEFSTKFVRHPAFVGHTQTSLDAGTRILGRVMSVTPEGSDAILMPGNHEKRLTDYVIQNAAAAFGLKRAVDPPSAWPVLSVPNLLGLDALGIMYGEAYPAGEYKLRDDIRVIHGHTVSSQGSSAATIAKKNPVSTIFGHVHRIEVHSQQWNLGSEIRDCITLTPGCLCATDGAVPSASSAINEDGSYVVSNENWNQGAAFLTFDADSGPISAEIAHIKNGETFFRGTRYKSTVNRFEWEF